MPEPTPQAETIDATRLDVFLFLLMRHHVPADVVDTCVAQAMGRDPAALVGRGNLHLLRHAQALATGLGGLSVPVR